MYSKAPTSRKISFVLIAIVGAACIALGLYGSATIDDYYDNHYGAINHISRTQNFFYE